MCGVAGRMLLELGLHNRDVSDHVLRSRRQREEIITLTCSIIILDRQWSASTGLPSNFQDSPFDPNTFLSVRLAAQLLCSRQFFESISFLILYTKHKGNDTADIMQNSSKPRHLI